MWLWVDHGALSSLSVLWGPRPASKLSLTPEFYDSEILIMASCWHLSLLFPSSAFTDRKLMLLEGFKALIFPFHCLIKAHIFNVLEEV